MSGTLVTIFILIAVVWQIISVIVAHAQQQKQRQAEAEARRQQVAARGGPQGSKRSSPTASPGEAHPKLSKLDELAARRQQQLEELRRRHESGRQPASASSGAQSSTESASTSQWESSTQLRTSQTSAGAGLPTTIERRGAPTTRPSKRPSPGQKQQRLQEQQRLARQQQQQLQQQQRSRMQREDQLSQRRRDDAIDRATGPYSAGEIGVAAARKSEHDAYGLAAPTAPDEPVRLARVSQLLHNRATLRELIVMKEVLDAPVSLREPRFV